MSLNAQTKNNAELNALSAIKNLPDNLKRPMQSPAYVLALAITAILMILIPVAYFSLAGLIGYGVFYYVIHVGKVIFSSSGGGATKLLVFLAPPFAGLTMIFFMFKPIFAKKDDSEEDGLLEVEDNEKFIEFVHGIANAVKAPLPYKVVIDANVNASAGFAPGMINFLRKRLILTVGLPLLRGMNTRELAGVLAHEFGHFSQGFGMYFSYIIRTISFWLQRVVYERDSWDISLKRSAEGADFRLALVINLAIGMVWLNRKLLWCFMMAGHFFSFYLMRQMEFDADQYEVQLTGSNQFSKTSKHIAFLSSAFQESIYWASNRWNDRKLPNDFGFIVSRFEQDYDLEFRKKVADDIDNQKSSIWATHPSDTDRKNRAEKIAVEGAFTVEDDCSILFNDFDELSSKSSKAYYRSVLGEEVDKADYLDSEEFIKESKLKGESNKAFVRFFGDVTGVATPIPINLTGSTDDVKDNQKILDDIKVHRETIAETMEKIKESSKNYDSTLRSLIDNLRGKAVLEAGFTINDGQFGFSGTTHSDAELAVKESQNKLDKAYEELVKNTAPVSKRLELGLMLANYEDLDVHSILEAGTAISEAWQLIQKSLHTSFALEILYSQEQIVSEQHLDTINSYSKDLHNCFIGVCDKLNNTPYPFPQEVTTLSLGAHLKLDGIAKEADFAEIVDYVDRGHNIVNDLYNRIMGRLALIAESAEKDHGLEPIVMPVHEVEDVQE